METKCVMVLDEDLGQGLAVNTAAVLALTLGTRVDSMVGPDVQDAAGSTHTGITTVPIPILKASRERVRELRNLGETNDELLVVDFTDAAQTTTTYDAYTEKLGTADPDRLAYLGIALYGPKKAVNKLAGSLPLMR